MAGQTRDRDEQPQASLQDHPQSGKRHLPRQFSRPPQPRSASIVAPPCQTPTRATKPSADTTRSTASGNNRPPFPITTTFWNKKVSNTHPPRALLQHCEERYNSIFLSRGKHQVIDSLFGSRLSQACIGRHDWPLTDNSATWLEKSRAEPS